MTRWRCVLLLPTLLVLAACAGQNVRTAAPAPTAGTDADATTVSQATTRPSGLSPEDPWEGLNRPIYAFNDVFDRILLRPVAKGYVALTPRPLRTGVSNFFANLQQPVTALNLVLEGHPGQAGTALGRFLMNATLGFGGLLDPASSVDIPLRSRDFGQTLAQWGWADSRYLVLPIFGPTTLRDALGKANGTSVSPVTWLATRQSGYVSILYGIDARAAVLPFESMLKGASDPYLLIRDAYLQRRRCQIVDCSEEVPDYLRPDYDFEIPDFESLRR